MNPSNIIYQQKERYYKSMIGGLFGKATPEEKAAKVAKTEAKVAAKAEAKAAAKAAAEVKAAEAKAIAEAKASAAKEAANNVTYKGKEKDGTIIDIVAKLEEKKEQRDGYISTRQTLTLTKGDKVRTVINKGVLHEDSLIEMSIIGIELKKDRINLDMVFRKKKLQLSLYITYQMNLFKKGSIRSDDGISDDTKMTGLRILDNIFFEKLWEDESIFK
jgi:hypothetical protein